MGHGLRFGKYGSFRDFVSDELKRTSDIVEISDDMRGEDSDQIPPYLQVRRVYDDLIPGKVAGEKLRKYTSNGWEIRLAEESAPEGCDKEYLSHWELEKLLNGGDDGKNKCNIVFAEVPERNNGKRKYCVQSTVGGTDYNEHFCLVEPLDHNRIARIVADCTRVSDVSLAGDDKNNPD